MTDARDFLLPEDDQELDQLVASALGVRASPDSERRLKEFLGTQTDGRSEPIRQTSVPSSSQRLRRFHSVRRRLNYAVVLGLGILIGVFGSRVFKGSGDNSSVDETVTSIRPPVPDAVADQGVVAAGAEASEQRPEDQLAADEAGMAAANLKPTRELRRRNLKEQLEEQLETVLVCLENDELTDEDRRSCCSPLLRKRVAFEQLLWQVVANSTGARRGLAVEAIGFVGTPRSVPSLLQTATIDDLRQSSLEALRRCGDAETLAWFVSQNESSEIGEEFAAELCERGDRASLHEILRLIAAGPISRSRILNFADRCSPQTLQMAVRLFDAPIVQDRTAAAILLGARRDKDTTRSLIDLSRSFPNRWEACAALMCNGTDEAIRHLQSMAVTPAGRITTQTASVQLKMLTEQ